MFPTTSSDFRLYCRKVIAYTAIASLTITPAASFSVPMGGVVADGAAGISTTATGVVINQVTGKAVIDWQGFDVGSGESAKFNVPDGNSFTLNRIHSDSASQINGQVTSNGQLMMINRNGVVFGKGAQVDVNGLVATTSDISNSDFMNGKSNFHSVGNENASVENHGTITILNGGSAALVAPNVKNSGTINANMGKVALAAGDTFAIDPYGDGLVQLAVPEHMTRGIVENSGTINAGGGKVQLATSLDEVSDSLINLNGVINADGGEVDITGGVVDQTGTISAKAGNVEITGNKISEQGAIIANNGSVDINFNKAYIDSTQAKITTSGTMPSRIIVKGTNKDTRLFASGTYEAKGTNAKGGTIKVTAGDIKLYAAAFNASGDTGGGLINIGGGFQGSGDLMHADTVSVNPYTNIIADALKTGKAGDIVVWSDKETRFGGNAYARGKGWLSDGGSIEVSSKDKLDLSGVTDVSSVFGKAGNILLDPKNIIISTTGQSYPTYELIDPSPSASNGFGDINNVVTLSNGNVLVRSIYDDFAAADAGAVYLFSGVTGALISTLRGSQVNDRAGVGGLTKLANGNFAVNSSQWSNGGASGAGAVTWGSSTLGVSGSISAANSIVGSTAFDGVGNGDITALTNGNYVISSTQWDNGAVFNAGAATWGNGLGGTVGVVSAANSLVGLSASDGVGTNVALTNGNYVVYSSNWDNGAVLNAGAVTWGNGLGGTVGAVGPAISLVGSTANDRIGTTLSVLNNGNYVASSRSWSDGAVASVGAVTWGNGLGGTVGAVSAANSLVGSTANDRIGLSVVLTNGNYVASSSLWDNGAVADAGAATWGNGLGGTVGAVSALNSLVGSQASDQVASFGVTALSNGNYVVRSQLWNNGAVASAGAVTWGNGLGGTVGTVSAANSLVGSTAFDEVGYDGVERLSNGNYVVLSSFWDNGAVVNAGAATWGNGLVGTVGTVSAANSLVGSQASDLVGSYGITALTNGNYVVSSQEWDNGAVVDAGAATWAKGDGTTVGVVSAANSLVGSTANDNLGSVSALTNGNYVVATSGWDNGAIVNAGAVTWGNGLGGTVGVVSAANSLVGTSANDNISSGGIAILNNGNYVVDSYDWDNGATANAGAVTWGNGLGGTAGAVSTANSMYGTTANDYVGSADTITVLANGNYVFVSDSWDNGAVVNAGAVTWGNGLGGSVGPVTKYNSIVGPGGGTLYKAYQNSVNSTFMASPDNSGRIYVASANGPSALNFNAFSPNDVTIHPNYLTNTLNTGTNITLQANNDISVNSAVTVAAGGAGGALTLQAGRSINVNANITTDNGNLNLIANSTAADGVVNAQRDAGAADITMGVGVVVNAGTGNVVFRIKDGAGNTNNTSGNITTRTINAGTFLADNTGTGDNVINGAITTTAAGNSLVMSTRGNINNVFGAGALNTGVGRFLLYGYNPAASTLNGIVGDFTEYSKTYINNPPASLLTSGNGLVWALLPPTGGGSATPSAIVPEPVAALPATPTPTSVVTFPGVTPVTPPAPLETGSTVQEIAVRAVDPFVIDTVQDAGDEFHTRPTSVRRNTPLPSMTGCVFSDNGAESDCMVSASSAGQ